jgi:hypothetical protein
VKTWIAGVVVLAALGGGGYIAAGHPELVRQGTHVVRNASPWVRTEAHLLGASSTAAPEPAAPTGVPASPITVVIPPPNAPLPSPARAWSAADCAWATGTLAWDLQLDTTEVADVASGRDTRYRNGPDVMAYYQGYATEWAIVLAEVEGACATHPTLMTDAGRADALAWFGKATAAHVADAAAQTNASWAPDTAADGGTGADAVAWDQQWEGNYARLTVLFAGTPSSP